MITFFTPTTIAAIAATTSLGLVGTLFLIAMLVQRVLFEGVEDARARRLTDAATIVFVPLLFMFALIVFFKIRDLLS
ncbi:MAG: hypothetical protein HGA19_23820 [Oscillochloris sp.]|nr:hypothetical protein [Oscillochloris sp.]